MYKPSHYPILKNNRDLRKINPAIEQHFLASEAETHFLFDIGGDEGAKYDLICFCPVCSSSRNDLTIRKWGGDYYECHDCGHVYLRNRPKRSILNDLYKSSIADELNRIVQSHNFNEQYWSAIYDKYTPYLMDLTGLGARLLDVGCGSGRFIKHIKKLNFFDISALDVYDSLPEVFSNILPRDSVFLVQEFEKFKNKKPFDILTFWGVLEHCIDPHAIFAKCQSSLQIGGILFFLIPNYHSRAKKLLNSETPTLNPRMHVNFFTEKSLQLLARKYCFEVLDFYQELPIIDLMWPHISDESSEDIIDSIVSQRECYYHIYILRKIS